MIHDSGGVHGNILSNCVKKNIKECVRLIVGQLLSILAKIG